ncbi:alpha/beta hydrolase [Thalassotalea castellviae]|uniref:Alpha/beta hydrolase-fold protein n=1 Tax=Thalassotalea castellviae TaxID=3075612 RepID=A0ABU3A453_9GAMM|nr:alpha/beta hydrolase-fold protein [Thalassotalea sp. W431]MDT0604739.1 alpha/beta hydrolase-fold protein [Thalassotalea sp. W431]
MPIQKRIYVSLYLCLVSFSLLGAESSKPLTVILKSPTEAILPYNVELSGTFNQWQLTGTSKMKWQDIEKHYQFNLPHDGSYTYFNFYKNGDWQNPISTEFGKPFTCGFIVDPIQESRFIPEFFGWAKESNIIPPRTVVGDLVTVTDFPMTLLDRTGDIFIYLPDNYRESMKKHYPVVYMLDGQNLFSESLSYSYEWRVDEIVTSMPLDVIIVGIANGPQRWQEYNPWDSVNYMGNSYEGLGEKTIRFILDELKPYIDQNYRTLKAAENTALLGSSLGGLMALYAGILHGESFGKVAAFSPAFSFSTAEAQATLNAEQSNLINAVKGLKESNKTKLYFDVGEVEYGSFALIEELYDSFLNAGYDRDQLRMVKDKLGRHCELDWSRRLPIALNWLFPTQR